MGGCEEEYSAFERLVGEHHKLLGRDLFILEIGSAFGRSTILLAQFGKVIAIDLWGDIHEGVEYPDMIGSNFDAFRETLQRFDLINKRVFPVLSTSKPLDLLPHMSFDVVYVDADHHYEPAKLDIQRSKNHLTQGGLFVVHDYKRPGDNPELGVNRAVDELLAEGDFVIKEHRRGLVCLQRKSVAA